MTPIRGHLFHNHRKYHSTRNLAAPKSTHHATPSTPSAPSPPPPKPRPYDAKPSAPYNPSSTIDVAPRSQLSPPSSSLADNSPSSENPSPPPRVTLASILWPFKRDGTQISSQSPRHDARSTAVDEADRAIGSTAQENRSRGVATTRRVVTEGVLDPRYKPAARRVTAIIVALPFALYLSYELFERRFLGKERRKFSADPSTIQDAAGETVVERSG